MQIGLAFIFLLVGIGVAEVTLHSFVTILSHNYGLTAQFDEARKLIKFTKSDDHDNFFVEGVADPARGWHIVELDNRVNGTTTHIRFPQARDGELATFDTEWASVFHVELHEDAVFSFTLLDPSTPGDKLAWTVERYSSNDQTMVLRIRPYDKRNTNQHFSIISRPRED
ncbi:hypothetical protein McanMca71_002399 [Microsporum canis]|uniref:Uncharacterized protein n=1 Tax=Arthroderma otae (strain ATCC MYA-4605 / CBS 113480) TaxID=554155 RepID=C5FYU0_ARTOC|nr:uncharacterized protein MCYG_07507 [Microsporum canis CBS 113480]EEQ34688.1 predicted protein [Microsporum canis CBS 113480]